MKRTKSEKTFMGKTWDEIMNSKSEREVDNIIRRRLKQVKEGKVISSEELRNRLFGKSEREGELKGIDQPSKLKGHLSQDTPSPDNKGNKWATWRRNGLNFKLFKPNEDITCPVCNIGKLNLMNQSREHKCSVCCRWFEVNI